ncbi:MAG: ABC transporter ATP-binding protein [Planctomycetes bacterium]|nr:ABC transporter ATP-binding protein [Planctomycetota bacterium]
MNPAIEFDDVYRRFNMQEVLRGLSFQVQEGQIYALLGRNGTGKTTALRILMGSLRPHLGETRVLGKASHSFGSAERENIGYVTEGHQLLKELSINQTLTFEDGTRSQFDRKFAEEALGRCGLERKKQIWQLSRGQRAQLSLILTVAGNPRTLILDDPALGLDTVMRRDFLDAMIDFLSGRGTTVLFSSHILTDVERIADRVGILQAGRLCLDASLDQIKQNVRLLSWYGAPWERLPEIPGLLCAKATRSGMNLTLSNASDETLAQLTSTGAQITEPTPATLEDLFLTLTTETETPGLLSPFVKEL